MPIFEEDLARTCANLQKTKKTLDKMPANVKKEYLERKRQKELERMLLPDAPPRKRARKNSPKRIPCRLASGTPTDPPPPKPQPWQHQLSTFDEVGSVASGSSTMSLMCNWTTGGLTQEDWLISAQVGLCASTVPPPPRRISATVTSADLERSGADVSGDPTQELPSQSPRTSANRVDITTVQSPAQLPTPQVESVTESQRSRIGGRIADLQTDSGQQILNEWLEQLSDGEVEEMDLDLGNLEEPELDFVSEAPAHLPHDVDGTLQEWLTQQDTDADTALEKLIPPDYLTFDWSHNAESFLGQREEFSGPSGPTFPITDSDRPMDIFLKFFTDDLFDILVTETNRHFGDIFRPLSQHSRFQRFNETSKDEMAIFIAVLIFQGMLPLTVEKDYWCHNGFLTLAHFKQLMSYNRFLLLKRLLHFEDNNAAVESGDDIKLRKLGPLLDLLNSKFKELYLPSRDIAIDESLLKWHGRLSFAQKIATKAAKVGVKTYELCESSSGYLWNFFIYTGKDQSHGEELDADRHDAEPTAVPSNATAQIVIDLVKPLLNRGHTLTMDNFYNSPLLARFLKNNGTDCLGTLRVNRKFVPESIKGMPKSELRPGEIVQSYCKDLAILLWRDKNIVAMLSTFHKGEIGGKKKYGTYRYKPQAVLDYNLSMGGVDKKDQLLSSQPIERGRNQAWYKKVFRRLLNVTVLNSYIIYKTRYPTMTQRQFRLRLANELVETFKSVSVPRPRPLTDEVNVVRIIQGKKTERPILRGNHFIGEGQSKYLTCVWCRKSRTKYICKQCSVALCISICFEEYHTKE